MKFSNYFFIISLIVVADLHSMERAKSWVNYYVLGKKETEKLPELPKDSLKEIFAQLVNRRDFENENDVINTLNSFNLASKNANLAVKEFLNEKAEKNPKYKSLIVSGDPTKTISKLFTQLKLDVMDNNIKEQSKKFIDVFKDKTVARDFAVIKFRNPNDSLRIDEMSLRKILDKILIYGVFNDSTKLEIMDKLSRNKKNQNYIILNFIRHLNSYMKHVYYQNYSRSSLNYYEPGVMFFLDLLNVLFKHGARISLALSPDINSFKSAVSDLERKYYSLFSREPKAITYLKRIVKLLEENREPGDMVGGGSISFA